MHDEKEASNVPSHNLGHNFGPEQGYGYGWLKRSHTHRVYVFCHHSDVYLRSIGEEDKPCPKYR